MWRYLLVGEVQNLWPSAKSGKIFSVEEVCLLDDIGVRMSLILSIVDCFAARASCCVPPGKLE